MGLNDFLSLGALFHDVTSLHPPSFHRYDFPLVYRLLGGGEGIDYPSKSKYFKREIIIINK